MQIQINKFLVVLTAIVLLGAVGCTTDTSQNNATNSNNQNTPVQQTPDETDTSKIKCSESELTNKITTNVKLPHIGQNFFSKTAVLRLQNQELTFEGAISSPGDEFIEFFKLIDKFQKANCAKKIMFKGGTANGSPPNFEWSNTGDMSNACNVNINEALEKSDLTEQMQNFASTLTDKELILTGKILDSDRNLHILKLFGTFLKDALGSPQYPHQPACISKIVFGSHNKTGVSTLIEPDFGWEICPPPQIECHGVCADDCGNKSITNSNPTNTNKNTNTNTNTNTNSR